MWQLIDSAFPSGGFAHSGGLEATWRHGEICNSEELTSFVESSLWQTASSMIPFVRAAHEVPDELTEWNRRCDQFLSNHVANRASRTQGRAFLGSAVRIFGAIAAPAIADLCHFAPAFGAVCRGLEISREQACDLFLFQSLRAWLSAAVRLGIIGPFEGQSIQNRMAARAREILEQTSMMTIDDVANVSPLLEIWQGSHDRLYSRLFQT